MVHSEIDETGIIEDIRRGMPDRAVQDKYSISPSRLTDIVNRAVASGFVAPRALEENGALGAGEVGQRSNDRPRLRERGTPVASEPKPDMRRMLVITDDVALVSTMKDALESPELSVVWFKEPVVDMAVISRIGPDLIMVEAGNPTVDHLHVIRLAHQADYPLQVILMADQSNREPALQGVELGAYDFVEKPIEARTLKRSVGRAIEYSDLLRFKRDHRRITLDEIEEKTLEIAERRDFLQGILDSSTLVSVVLTDLDQNVLFWNKGAENIFGYKAREIIGTKITKLYPPDSIAKERVEELRTMLQTKSGTVHGKMKQLSKTGEELTVSLAISPMLDPLGELRGILGVGLDVTEEVRQHEEIVRLLDQVERTRDVTIFSLAKLAESRDEETGAHLTRIQEYCRILCNQLARRNKYRSMVTSHYIEDLVKSSVLHDIGKVAIPDSVLMSPGKFGPKERQIMKQHPIVGGRALVEAAERLGGETTFLTLGMEVAYYHHERWDGYGYPFAKKGEEIPLSARIVAVADVYDALTTARRYKEAFPHEKARSLIVEAKGKQFDPELIETFEEVEGEFERIRSTI